MQVFKLNLAIALIIVVFCCGRVENAEGDINCYTCNSTDPNCINNPKTVELKKCDSKQCFTKSDNGKISRGCLEEGDKSCPDHPTCYHCTTDKCNVNLICKNCTSVTDPDCAKTDANKESYNSVCSLQQKSCLSIVAADKHLERRCTKEADKCETNDNNCHTCPDTNCNIGVFPSNRLRCYQCESTNSKCGDVNANNDIKSLPCLLYKSDDKCYTIGSSATSMTRGCTSDADTNINKCSDPTSNKDCGVCDKDNCNNLEYQRDQTMKCIQCTSSTNKNCMFDQPAESAENCKEKLLYNQKDSCFLEKRADKSVMRGCLYDRAKDDPECKSPDCIVCDTGNACNKQEDTSFTCIRCRSDENTKCIDKANEIQGSKCRNQELTASNKDCYMGTWNNVVIRGCLVDTDERQQIICNDEKNKQCIKCNGKDCNIEKANGASNIQLASSMFVLFALSLWTLH